MKLAIIEPLGINKQTLIAALAAALPPVAEIVCYDDRPRNDQEIAARGADADIIISANQPLSAAAIAGWHHVKLLAIAFTGLDHVDLDAAKVQNIKVINAAGYADIATAELAIGLCLSLLRRLKENDSNARTGLARLGLGGELCGRRFGLIGCGRIGQATAALAAAFGCEVYASFTRPKDIPYIKFIDFEDLLRHCDIVSLHLPLNDQTIGVINARRLALLSPHALLINTARGALVDNIALAASLNTGHLGGAGIDVLETEPPWDKKHPLLTAKNTIITPHIGFATDQAMLRRVDIILKHIQHWLGQRAELERQLGTIEMTLPAVRG